MWSPAASDSGGSGSTEGSYEVLYRRDWSLEDLEEVEEEGNAESEDEAVLEEREESDCLPPSARVLDFSGASENPTARPW